MKELSKEDKELLLKDLCARLPYGVVINVGDKDLTLDKKHQNIGVLYPEDCSDEFNERNNNASFYIVISGCYYGEEIKPYLRPMPSMTEEERKEYERFSHCSIGLAPILMDWLYLHHLDCCGLIPKGLALEAPKDMYTN